MKKLGIGCLAVLGILVVLVVIVAIAGGGASQPAATPTMAQVAAVAGAPAPEPTPTPVPVTPTKPAPTATSPRPTATVTSPSATPTPAVRVVKVGERVVSGGIALTVNAVERQEKMAAPGGFTLSPEKPGHEFVIVDVTVENVERDQAPYNPLYFKVKDADGYEYNMSISMDPQTLKSGELARGEKARGTVTFSVPKGRKGLILTYQPLVIAGGYQVMRVALD